MASTRQSGIDIIRSASLWAGLAALGLVIAMTGGAAVRYGAITIVTIGIAGLANCVRNAARLRTDQQTRDRRDARRQALKAARRERDLQSRERRAASAARRQAVEAAAGRLRAERTALLDDAARRAMNSRNERDHAAGARFAIITAMSDSEFRAEVVRLFERRGYRIDDLGEEQNRDIALIRSSGEQAELLRIVPRIHVTMGSDVTDADAARVSAGAGRIYLTAQQAFLPSAVRAASHYSVILLDPHVLATWAVSAEEE